MEKTDSFKFATLFIKGQEKVQSFEGNFVTTTPVPVIENRIDKECFVFFDHNVHLLLSETSLDEKDIDANIYTVSDPKKIHNVLVQIAQGNTVEVPSIFPIGTQFTHLGTVNFYAMGNGSIFLATKSIEQ